VNDEPLDSVSHPEPALNRTPSRRSLWSVPTVLMLLSLLCIVTIDGPLGHWIHLHPPVKPVRVFFETAEHFGTPAGQFLLLLVVGWMTGPSQAESPTLQWDVRVPRIFVGALVSGLAANVVKMCLVVLVPCFPWEQAEPVPRVFLRDTPPARSASRSCSVGPGRSDGVSSTCWRPSLACNASCPMRTSPAMSSPVPPSVGSAHKCTSATALSPAGGRDWSSVSNTG